jgi:hypothetical protein
MTMKTYHVFLGKENDCTEVDAENEAEARGLARTVFEESDDEVRAAGADMIVEEVA